MELYIEKWLTDKVLQWKQSRFFSVERVHRVPGQPPRLGAPPRPIIVRLRNFRDRDHILQQARSHGPWRVDSREVNIYLDFTNIVQKQRNTYVPVKRVLRQLDIKYALFFPAKLRVIYKERTHFFQTAEAVWDWMEAPGLQAHKATEKDKEEAKDALEPEKTRDT